DIGGAHFNSSSRFANVNGKLFFSTEEPAFPDKLWISDGTRAGTVPIIERSELSIFRVANVGDTLFFSASQGAGVELWKSDGTSAGTVMVKRMTSVPAGIDPQFLTDVGGTLFFRM